MRRSAGGLPPLELLRGFEAAARHLSFTRAARELFLTQSAISRQVQALEEALEVPLFHRRHRSLLLTDEGQMLYRSVARSFDELRGTVERITRHTSHMVTVTTLVTFAALWLVPRLAEFRRRHPGIDVRISAANELVDLERERIDVAIRYTSPDRVAAGTRKLFDEEVLPVCAPALRASKNPPLREPEDLANHVLLHLDDPPGTSPYLEWDTWLEAVGLPDLEPAGALHFSHYDQLIQAAADGEGVALGRLPLLSRQIRDGRLVAPFESDRFSGRAPRSSRAYYILCASQRPEVHTFVGWLQRQAQDEITGDAPPPRRRRAARSTR